MARTVIAVDVGLRNMSWCVCAGPEGLEPQELAARLRLISWTTETLPLPAGARPADALRAVVEHVAGKEELLRAADAVGSATRGPRAATAFAAEAGARRAGRARALRRPLQLGGAEARGRGADAPRLG